MRKRKQARSRLNAALFRMVTGKEPREAIAFIEANKDSIDFTDGELLLECARSGSVALLKSALRCGGSIDVRFNGYTLTHAAVASAQPECVRFVLTEGGPPDEETISGNGETPLYLNSSECRLDLGEEATRKARVSIARELMAHGANPNLVGDHSETPLFLALKHQNQALATFLVRNGAVPTGNAAVDLEVLCAAVELGSLALLRELIENGWDPKRLPSDPLALPLSFAVQAENFGMVKLLVEHGADPERKAYFSEAAIDLAREAKDKRILRFLERHMDEASN